MSLQISITDDNVKCYPQHKHSFWEIMFYLEGEGYLYTTEKNIPFKPNTVIIVPPKIVHGSVSNKPFKNISVGGKFDNSFFFDSPLRLEDSPDSDGKTLATMLYKNRMASEQYIKSLSTVYVNYILSAISLEKPINLVINQIVDSISNNATSLDFNISKLLNSYNYSVDYIRQQFKSATGMHPIEFLTKCRMDRACFLIDVYGKSMLLSQIAESCGYTDYVYFSKQFKQHTGHSPKEYLKKRID